MTPRDRASIAKAAKSALEVVGTFGLHGFRVARLARGEGNDIRVSKVSTGAGFGWKCMRCLTSGAFYGEGRHIDACMTLARFIGAHTGEVCPC